MKLKTTPKQDGFRMPAEYEPQKKIWMIWPYRPDNWRDNALPAQKAFAEVAKAISMFEPVVMLASKEQYNKCRKALSSEIQVVEMESDDAWCRDVGATFLVDDKGRLRACDWTFNAWGGNVDGLYSSWDKDDKIASQICELEGIDYYRTENFVLEGGSIHVDGEGTVLTTKMCLLSEGRNPHMSQKEIEHMLCEYLNCSKVLWLEDGIDPDETNGHIDDVACFTVPGEVVCAYTDDRSHPFYEALHKAYNDLCNMTDAKGRPLKVHKLCCPAEPVLIGDFDIAEVNGSKARNKGDLCIASYVNFLVVNGGVIVPQYGDINDGRALKELQALFPDRKVVGVYTREIVYGGGNIHCITQQEPKVD